MVQISQLSHITSRDCCMTFTRISHNSRTCKTFAVLLLKYSMTVARLLLNIRTTFMQLSDKFWPKFSREYTQHSCSICVTYADVLLEREREMFYLTMHSTHFIYGYMASDIWLRTILIVRKETCCRHIGHSYRLTARVLLYAPSHRQDSTYHGLCYTSHGALAGKRNSSLGPPHEGSIRRPTAP